MRKILFILLISLISLSCSRPHDIIVAEKIYTPPRAHIGSGVVFEKSPAIYEVVYYVWVTDGVERKRGKRTVRVTEDQFKYISVGDTLRYYP